LKTKGFNFYLKLLVSASLLSYLFVKVGWQDLWLTVQDTNVFFLTLYILVGLLATGVSSRKWHLLVKTQGFSVSQSRLFFLYMVGFFFNQLLPTSVGGDVVRAYELGKQSERRAEAMASVFMERFTGLTTLILFALVAICFSQLALGDRRLIIVFGAAFVGYLIGVWMVFNRSFLAFLEKRISIKFMQKIFSKIRKVQDSIYAYRHQKMALVYAFIYSIIFYI